MAENDADQKKSAVYAARSMTLGFTSYKLPKPEVPPGCRGKILSFIQHPAFDPLMGLLIIFNVVIMIRDADMQTTCKGCDDVFSMACNNALLVIYTAELALRLFAYGRKFFKSPWNVLDFGIVAIGLSDLIMIDLLPLPNLQMLRLFRLARLTRIIRLLKQFPTLFVLVQGFAGAMEAMAWGFVLILILLMIWALIAVELVHEVSVKVHQGKNEWCEEAFESVVRAVIYFFQTLVSGDSWGTCAIPIMQESPATFLVFAGALVSVQLGFTNLILAIIVDKAVVARDSDNEGVIRKKKAQKREFAEQLRRVLECADKDGNGNLTFEEVCETYEANPEVRQHFDLMDVDRRDLKHLFRLMESEEMKGVSYNEFISIFQKAQLQDLRVYLMVMQLQVKQVAGMMRQMNGMCARFSDGESFMSQVASRVSVNEADLKGPRVVMQDMAPTPSSINGTTSETQEAAAEDASLNGRPRSAVAFEEVKQAMSPPQWEPAFWQLSPLDLADKPGQEQSFTAELQQLGASLESRLKALADDTMERIAALARQADSSRMLPARAAVSAAKTSAAVDSTLPHSNRGQGGGRRPGETMPPCKEPGSAADDAGVALLHVQQGRCPAELGGLPGAGEEEERRVSIKSSVGIGEPRSRRRMSTTFVRAALAEDEDEDEA